MIASLFSIDNVFEVPNDRSIGYFNDSISLWKWWLIFPLQISLRQKSFIMRVTWWRINSKGCTGILWRVSTPFNEINFELGFNRMCLEVSMVNMKLAFPTVSMENSISTLIIARMSKTPLVVIVKRWAYLLDQKWHLVIIRVQSLLITACWNVLSAHRSMHCWISISPSYCGDLVW
jgi:hypothetical protein